MCDLSGTHTGASMAGSISDSDPFETSQSYQRLIRYGGTARGSKLAIFDFNDGQTTNKIKTPHDIYDLYFKRAHNSAKATISSNSWVCQIVLLLLLIMQLNRI